MTVDEFNQRVAVGAQVAFSHNYDNRFARTETGATPLFGIVIVRGIDGYLNSATVRMITPLWFGEECDD